MRLLKSDVTKLFLYFIGCFLLAALITPWLYNAGTFLGELTEDGTRNKAVDWVGMHARKADLPDYFDRGLLVSALLLFFPLIFWLRMRNEPAPLRDSPWSIYLPDRAIAANHGQPLTNPRTGWLQLLVGALLASGLFFVMGWLLLSLGWFTIKDPVPWGMAWSKAAMPTVAASLLEEVLFRGILLGICLRTFRPSVAIVLIALLFAGLHFLQPPADVAVFSPDAPVPAGGRYIDPHSNAAGFQLLQAIALRFQHLEVVLYEFLSLAAVGLILGYARYSTASLWLPIGLHSGWIFAYVFFGRIASRAPDLDAKLDLMIGNDLKEGLLPLATLAVNAFLVFLFLRIGIGKARDDEEALATGAA